MATSSGKQSDNESPGKESGCVDLVNSLTHKQRCEMFMDGYIRTNGIDDNVPINVKIDLICNLWLNLMKFIRSYTEIHAQKQREHELFLIIKFESKPMGFTIYRGYQSKNAWIADIKDDNIHIGKDGLVIGLYLHSVNDEIVDNMDYHEIIRKCKNTPAPLTIGFGGQPPLPKDDERVKLLLNHGYTWNEIHCAKIELLKQDQYTRYPYAELLKILKTYNKLL